MMRYLTACGRNKQIEENNLCIKCGKPGIEKPGEALPDKGTLIKVIHPNGTTCEFVEYQSISTFLVRSKRKRDPKVVDCPVCQQKGIIHGYRPHKDKQFHKWEYYITHEAIGGYWGKNHKVKKYRRCYMKTEEQRNQVLKTLGRYKY